MRKVYEIKLEHDLGYGYIDLSFDIPDSFGSMLFNIVDFHSDNPFQGEGHLVSDHSYLIAPSVGGMQPPKRKAKGWRLLSGEYGLKGYEKDVFFKLNSGFKAWREHDWPNLRWHSFKGYEPSGLDGYDYQQVSHLPFWTHIHPDYLITKLTMIWLKRWGKTITDYYDIEKIDWNIKAIYYDVINTPFYDEIEISDWYKPIGERKWRERTI